MHITTHIKNQDSSFNSKICLVILIVGAQIMFLTTFAFSASTPAVMTTALASTIPVTITATPPQKLKSLTHAHLHDAQEATAHAHTAAKSPHPAKLFPADYSVAYAAYYTPNHTTLWSAIKGKPYPNLLYLGMWTLHLRKRGAHQPVNWLIGGLYHSVFAGTFLNSYDKRSYAIGLQRAVWAKSLSHDTNYALGYRVGLIHGYDGRLSTLAGKTPIIPFISLLSDLTYKHVGWEVSYTGIVISTSFYITF